jgi:hypothetical protein
MMKFRVGDTVLIEARVDRVEDEKELIISPLNRRYDRYSQTVNYFVEADKTTLLERVIKVDDKFQRLRDGEIVSVFGIDKDDVVFRVGSDVKSYQSMNRRLFLSSFMLVEK